MMCLPFRLRRTTVAALLLSAALLCSLSIWACDAWIRSAAGGQCHDHLPQVPAAPVGLVLGCSPSLQERPNLFYTHRIHAAAQLYRSGKIQALIVSGDNGTHAYDEPTAMKADLVQAGVPEEHIYCDYAGFRTLDSVVRAHSIFGQNRFIIVSQRFHNERAIFLARRHGLEASGYNARDVSPAIAPTTWLREYLARVKAVLDVTLLRTRPKFDGPPVKIEA